MRAIGAWDSGRARRIGGSALTMLGGAILSLVVLYMLSSNPSGVTVALGVVAGMIIGQGVRTAVIRR
jgi:hypothetical protein